jgi:hypothetical protein
MTIEEEVVEESTVEAIEFVVAEGSELSNAHTPEATLINFDPGRNILNELFTEDAELNKLNAKIYFLDQSEWNALDDEEQTKIVQAMSYEFYNAWAKVDEGAATTSKVEIWDENLSLCTSDECLSSPHNSETHPLIDPYDPYPRYSLSEGVAQCPNCNCQTEEFWSEKRTEDYLRSHLDEGGRVYLATNEEGELTAWNWFKSVKVKEKLEKSFILKDGKYHPVGIELPFPYSKMTAVYMETGGFTTGILNDRESAVKNKVLLRRVMPTIIKRELKQNSLKTKSLPIWMIRTHRSAGHVIKTVERSGRQLGMGILQVAGQDVYGAPNRVYMAPKFLTASPVKIMDKSSDIGVLDADGGHSEITEEIKDLSLSRNEYLVREMEVSILRIIEEAEGIGIDGLNDNDFQILREHLKEGLLNERLAKAAKISLLAAAVSHVVNPYMNTVVAGLIASIGFSDLPGTMKALSAAGLSLFEYNPLMGGFASIVRIVGVQMPLHSIPRAITLFNERRKEANTSHEVYLDNSVAKDALQSALYALYPLVTIFNGGFAGTYAAEALTDRTLNKVLLWKFKKEFLSLYGKMYKGRKKR